MELPRFPIGSAALCIPVRESTCENPFRCNATPSIVQRPTQLASARHAPKNDNLRNSGSLGQCDDPDCLDCRKNKLNLQRSPAPFDNKGGGWMNKIWLSLRNIPVMNPHAKAVRRWNQFFAMSCLVAIFIDPLFFFVPSMDKDKKCIVFNWQFAKAVIVARTVTYAVYCLHMLLQFRIAYVDPESRVIGTGDLVDEPKKIATHYLRGAFHSRTYLFASTPSCIVMATRVIPKYVGVFSANYAKVVQLLGGQSANGFIFESAWANFVINLLLFVLAGHVVGSCWYHFGLQQISTLAGNLVPSYFIWEVLFTKGIIALGLLLFAVLIGNMQNFLQSLGKRRMDMQLRRHDVEQWMSHRQLPEDLRRRVRPAERFNWVATRGVNEEELLMNLPEDIQRDIQHHFFRFLDKIRLFTMKDCPIWDAICHKLKHNLYISGSDIICQGRHVEKVIFIVWGKAESIAADGSKFLLHKGAVCGEELLMWYLEQPSVNKDGGGTKVDPIRWMSIRTVRCLTNVEAFVLQASDVEEVTLEFSRFLCNPFVVAAIRYQSVGGT